MENSTVAALPSDRSDLRTVASNISWQLSGELVNKALTFLSSIYLARVLSVEGYGKFSYVWVFITYGMLVTSEGLVGHGIREVAKDRNNLGKLVVNITSLRLGLAAAVYVITCLASLLISSSWDMRLLFIFTFLWLFPHTLCLDWAYRGLDKMSYSAVWNFVHQAVLMILLLLFVHSSRDLLRVPVFKTLGAVLASTVLWWIMLSRNGFLKGFSIKKELAPRTWKPLLKISFHMGGSYAMILLINNLPITMLMAWDTHKAVGLYSAAFNIIMMSLTLGYLISDSFYPRLSHASLNDKASFLRLFKAKVLLMGSLGFFLSAATYFLSPYIIPTFFGHAYLDTIATLRLLSPVIFLAFIVMTLKACFLSAGFERPSFVVTAIGAVASIILNTLLIPRYSLAGAAIATNLAFALTIVAYVLILNKTHLFHAR